MEKTKAGVLIWSCYSFIITVFDLRLTNRELSVEMVPITSDMALHHFQTQKMMIMTAISFEHAITVIFTDEFISYKFKNFLTLFVR